MTSGDDYHFPKTWKRDGLIAFAASLTQMADDVASRSELMDEERTAVRESAQQLKQAIDGLIKIISAHDALQMGNVEWREPFDPDGMVLLWSALGAAFTLGGRAVQNPIMQRIQQEAQHASAARARQAKARTSRAVDELIIKAAGPVWEKRSRWTSNRMQLKSWLL